MNGLLFFRLDRVKKICAVFIRPSNNWFPWRFAPGRGTKPTAARRISPAISV
jgi:hypothetical protein